MLREVNATTGREGRILGFEGDAAAAAPGSVVTFAPATAVAAESASNVVEFDDARTVRSGYAYRLNPTAAVPPSDPERAARVKARLEGAVLCGTEARPVYRFVKRAFDIVFSLGVIIVFSWLFLLIAILIKIDDPQGPVFFKQQRVGKLDANGKPTYFNMLKFRSMCVDAEEKLAELKELNEKTGPVFKIAEDPRITRVGKWLRKLSLDELPQFFNVLAGSISVVGPRPALSAEVLTYTNYQKQRLLVKPGITCYWQTCRNRDVITFDEWVDMDLLYVKQCGVWADFKLIVQTVGVVLTAQGS